MVRARHANGGAIPKESRLENAGIARGTIYVGTQICTKYSFFVKPTVKVLSSHECRGIGITMAWVTIENFWARRGRDAGEKRARTFANFDVGTVFFFSGTWACK